MRKVFVIAGHNGKGTGASGIIDEGEETMRVRDKIVAFMEDMGFGEVYSDKGKDKENLGSIVSWLKTVCEKDDIVLDIHFNSFSSASANGTEVLIPNNPTEIESKLAKSIHILMTENIGFKGRGVKSEDSGQHSKLAMLSGFDGQQVLLEICFVSNQADCDKYKANFDGICEGVATILGYYQNM